jgi:hypothetical protein
MNESSDYLKIHIYNKRKNNFIKWFSFFVLFIAFTFPFVFAFSYQNRVLNKIRLDNIYSFDECAMLKDSLILESYPEVCITKDGKRFVRKISKGFGFADLNDIENINSWIEYKKQEFAFTIKYHPETQPKEFIGSDDVGQFTYIFLVDFSSGEQNPLNSTFGYNLAVKRMDLDNTKLELVGHVTDKIDSEEQVEINGNEWVLLNYLLYVTNVEVPVTSAFTQKGDISYQITATSSNIIQILSAFKFVDDQTLGISDDNLSCTDKYSELLEEITHCNLFKTKDCQAIVSEYFECFNNCVKNTSSENCKRVCKPFCED